MLNDVQCELGEAKNGEFLIDSRRVSTFKPVDLEEGNLVYILKNQMAAGDEFDINCYNGKKSQSARAKIRVQSAIKTRQDEPFVLNPNGPTKFDEIQIDLSSLDDFKPIEFDLLTNQNISALRYMPFMTNSTDCQEYNEFFFCPVDHFDSLEMAEGRIFLNGTRFSTGQLFAAEFMVSAKGLPRVFYKLPLRVGVKDEPLFLPNFGLKRHELADNERPTSIPDTGLDEITNGFAIDAVTGNEDLLAKNPEPEKLPKVSLDEGAAYDETDDEDLSLGQLLYIVPIAIICVLLLIIVGVFLLMRSNRRNRGELEKSNLTKYAQASPVSNVQTEERDKSTTYVIAAAQDSTVKVTVQQNKYESQLPATTVRALAPEESVFGGSSDDGGHTAYAGSNYFGVMSMSNYGESRADDEFESESLVSFGTQVTSQEQQQHQADVKRQQQYWV